MKKYYALETSGNEADIYIFGDIVDPFTKEVWGIEADVSPYSLVREIGALSADVINVHINSYGGYVSEGVAIYNTLANHQALVRTYCDGFACSAASVVFMAGRERYMYPASLLMIHNAWTNATGNADGLRKVADELDTVSQAAANAYKSHMSISDEELQQMLDAETWITPEKALESGFATGILRAPEAQKASASARASVYARLMREDTPPQNDIPEPRSDKVMSLIHALMGGKEGYHEKS